MDKYKVAIFGASGYTGAELVRILLNHPNVEISYLIAYNNSDQDLSSIYPSFSQSNLPKISKIEDVNFDNLDVVFCCLPHTTSQKIIKEISKYNILIIDLSADFRLKDINNYKFWYKSDHIAPDIQKEAVYGLTEINQNLIKKAKLISCPGCYPTSILIPLIPLIKNDLVDTKNIIIDSKSGFSGAGRKVDVNTIFCEINDSFKAYSIGDHRHISEIEQELALFSNSDIKINFTPHIIPITRGILSTIYIDIKNQFSINDLKNCLNTFYEDSPFIKVIDNPPSIKNVAGSNFCFFNVNKGRTEKKAIIVSVIDNLIKGASGQAVQNMNIRLGIDEKTGLTQLPLVP